MKRYVQYGCGFSAPKEWINYDASPTLKFEKVPVIGKLYTKNVNRFPSNVLYGNIINGLPESPESCDGVYCSHILEHLAYKDAIKALYNTWTILKPNGIFRCVVPDLKEAIRYYNNNYEKLDFPAHEFLNMTMLGVSTRPRGINGVVKQMMGNSKHLWMWDEKTLINELQKIGFSSIRKAEYGDSKDEHFKFVEEKTRFYGAVAIECSK
jgi:SAM-dependent methyltransferase